MKAVLLLAIAIVTLSSLPVVSRLNNAEAQESSAQVSESASAHAGNTQASSSTSSSAAAEMRPVNAELVGKLDTKSAKVGDTVVAKTKEKIRTADGTEIPKGSRLMGHVTEVQARGSGHSESHMGIVFDRAELRGGQSIAIHSVIQSIAPPASAAAAMDMGAEDAFAAPSSGSMASAGSMGGAVHSGGLAGSGLVGGAVGSTAGVTSSVAPTANDIPRSTAGLAGSTSTSAISDVHGAAGTTESRGPRSTAIPGVRLAGDASGSASGTLSAADRNIHLDSGSQLVLGITTAGPR